jgi:integrase
MATRRSATGGTVRKHPVRDIWEARFFGADGRRHSVFGKTKREAQEKLRAALLDSDRGILPVGRRLTVETYLREWLEMSVAQRCRPRTIESYRETVERYIIPAIGRVTMAKLEPDHVARMLTDLGKRGTLSPTTVRYVYVVLRIALGRAMKQGKVVRNVATLVDPPARATRELRPLGGPEVRSFLDTVQGDRLAPLYLAAIGTGLRQGELLGLRWSDVDLDAATLTVRHSLQRDTRCLAEPKTERGRRRLSLPSMVVTGLREQRRRQLEERLAAGPKWADADFVFTTLLGAPLSAWYVTRQFQVSLRAARLPHQPFHGLRHACATLLLEQGEELGVVSRILGHADIATTANIYAHFTRGLAERAAARMDLVLERTESAATG